MAEHELARRLEAELLTTYDIAKRECRYNAMYFLEMIQTHGGLETVKRLLASSTVPSGLGQLWECGRLDISVEAVVLRPEYRPLFSERELAVAAGRLEELGYLPPWLAV
jgi:hypothetical protein